MYRKDLVDAAERLLASISVGRDKGITYEPVEITLQVGDIKLLANHIIREHGPRTEVEPTTKTNLTTYEKAEIPGDT